MACSGKASKLIIIFRAIYPYLGLKVKRSWGTFLAFWTSQGTPNPPRVEGNHLFGIEQCSYQSRARRSGTSSRPITGWDQGILEGHFPLLRPSFFFLGSLASSWNIFPFNPLMIFSKSVEWKWEFVSFSKAFSWVASTRFTFSSTNWTRDSMQDILSKVTRSQEQVASKSWAREAFSYSRTSVRELAAAICPFS